MINSMTGYATLRGSNALFDWVWDVRSVNNKGLDIRVRAPDWISGLDQSVRNFLQAELGRGSIQLNLKVSRKKDSEPLQSAKYEKIFDAAQTISEEAGKRGAVVSPLSILDIMHLHERSEETLLEGDVKDILANLMQELPSVVSDLKKMRANEGAALSEVLSTQIYEIERLIQAASALLATRKNDHEQAFQRAVLRLTNEEIDTNRLAQELALLAVKSDITEEIDRLTGHVNAAKNLLKENGPVGRKFDFLMQEFNREANTLCAKSASSELTSIGLDLKVVIDQTREQVQNVE